MVIYKIFTAPQWTDMQARGHSDGAPVDLADGFIHFSTAEQAGETATRHFAGQDDLWLIAVDADGLEALKWEVSRGGARFPHLYEVLQMADVLWAEPLPIGDDGHVFPETMQ